MLAPIRDRVEYKRLNDEINELVCRYYESYDNPHSVIESSDTLCLKTWKLIQYIKKELKGLTDAHLADIPSFGDAVSEYYCTGMYSFQEEITVLEGLSRAAFKMMKEARCEKV